MSSNLLKGRYLNGNDSTSTEKFIIDTNELAIKRLEAIKASMKKPENREFTDGFVQGLAAEKVNVLLADDEEQSSGIIKAESQNAQEVLASANEEAMAIVQNANMQAESILAEAKKQAEQARQKAVEEGKSQGYRDGSNKALAEIENMKKELKSKEAELEKQYQKQVDVIETELVDVITDIYEHVFHVELRSYREILTHLISTTMRKIDSGREFVVHVSKEDYPFVSMQKKQLAAGVGGSNSSVEVIEDMTLSRNECMIETEGGIFDCGLGTQMHELRQRLLLLSYQK